MHDDLDTNAATEGEFSSDTCTDYYAHIDVKLAGINAELALAAGDDGLLPADARKIAISRSHAS